MNNECRDTARINRRALLAGSALALVAGQAQAQQTPSHAGSHPAAGAPDTTRAWASSLAPIRSIGTRLAATTI